MDVTLLYFDGCPNWKVAGDRLTGDERSDITVTHRLVESVDEAERWGFHGSPSILVDGVDLFADADADAGVGLSCRVYQTPSGSLRSPNGRPASHRRGRRCDSPVVDSRYWHLGAAGIVAGVWLTSWSLVGQSDLAVPITHERWPRSRFGPVCTAEFCPHCAPQDTQRSSRPHYRRKDY